MTYLTDLELSLVADGCDTRRYLWGDWPLLAGWRTDERGAPPRGLQLFTIAVAMDDVGLADVRSFERRAVAFARALRGGLRSDPRIPLSGEVPSWVQPETMVFPAMIGVNVTQEAAVWATRRRPRRGDIVSRPVVVDEGRGSVSTFRGRPVLGRVSAGYLDEKRDRYFPMAASVQR